MGSPLVVRRGLWLARFNNSWSYWTAMTLPRIPVDAPSTSTPSVPGRPAATSLIRLPPTPFSWPGRRSGPCWCGEPGTGKSQLARAAAQTLNRAFISEVVHARTEPQDLLWRFDTVGRLGEAQALAARGAQSPAGESTPSTRGTSSAPAPCGGLSTGSRPGSVRPAAVIRPQPRPRRRMDPGGGLRAAHR
jgi:hypothetical protein